MWKCPCCGLPRFHAGRMSSGPHPETPKPYPETPPRSPTPKPHPEAPPRNPTPKPWSLQIEECACGSVLAVACHVTMRGARHHDPTPKPHPETLACVSDVCMCKWRNCRMCKWKFGPQEQWQMKVYMDPRTCQNLRKSWWWRASILGGRSKYW